MYEKIKAYLFLHSLFFLYSCYSICSKFAAKMQLFSFEFIIVYFFALLFLGVYALCWQQILKKIPLTVAYANKAVTVIWGMLWGAILFHEQITLNMIIGAVIVVLGVFIVVTGGASENE